MFKCYLILLFVVSNLFFSPLIAHQSDSILDYLPAIIAAAPKLPVPIAFSVRSPSISNQVEYVIDLDYWDIPSNRTKPAQTTENLQAAIDWAKEQGYGRVVLPPGRYLIGVTGNAIYQSGIDLYSETEFVMSGATIEMRANNKWNYCVIRVLNQSDVIIRGGVIKGDRRAHIFTPRASDGKTAHDEGHGVCVWNESARVQVSETRLHDLTGDGSLVLSSTDVGFYNNKIYSNRRQGISIVGGIRVAIEGNEIHHISGTSPQFGIDIEGAGRKDKDILIRNNYFHHNRGGDIVNTSGENVFIVNNTLEQGAGSSYIDGPIVSWHRTDNIISGNTLTMDSGSVNGRLGYIQYSSGGNKGHSRVTYVWDNICNGCGMYMYKSADADIRRNRFIGYFLSLNTFTNATVIDNKITSSGIYCWSYRMRDTTGVAHGNTYNGEAYNLPLSKKPYSTPCLNGGI